METIGERIRQIRKEKKLTQVEFGQLIGISGAGVGKIETDVSRPTDAAVKLICATYHVNYLWLTEGAGPVYEEATGDAFIDRYAPDADEKARALLTELLKLPDSAWYALRDYLQYMLSALDKARENEKEEQL